MYALTYVCIYLYGFSRGKNMIPRPSTWLGRVPFVSGAPPLELPGRPWRESSVPESKVLSWFTCHAQPRDPKRSFVVDPYQTRQPWWNYRFSAEKSIDVWWVQNNNCKLWENTIFVVYSDSLWAIYKGVLPVTTSLQNRFYVVWRSYSFERYVPIFRTKTRENLTYLFSLSGIPELGRL